MPTGLSQVWRGANGLDRGNDQLAYSQRVVCVFQADVAFDVSSVIDNGVLSRIDLINSKQCNTPFLKFLKSPNQ